ncbi:MAG: hypothetical protein OHK0039_34860 [Bacteroidia bacterium]
MDRFDRDPETIEIRKYYRNSFIFTQLEGKNRRDTTPHNSNPLTRTDKPYRLFDAYGTRAFGQAVCN